MSTLGAWVDTDPPVDAQCFDWTRLFRVPYARRDGVVLSAEVVDPGPSLNPYGCMERWGVALEAEVAPQVAAYGSEDCPVTPMDLDYGDWVAAYAYPHLKAGMAFTPDEGGHVYPVVRRVLASLAATGKIADPWLLASLIWDSIDATPGITIEQVWRLCEWTAGQQAHANARAAEVPDQPPNPPPEPTVEEWEAVRPFFRGNLKRVYYRMRDGVPLVAQKSRMTEMTWLVARKLGESARVPSAELLYGMLYKSNEAGSPNTPMPRDLWDKCRQVVDEVKDRNDNEAIARVYCAEYPLTIKVVGPGGPLFQLDTTRQPPRYMVTDPTSVYLHFDRFTKERLPFEAEVPTAMPLPEILRTYGATVSKALFVSGQRGTTYDPHAGTLLQGVHILEPADAVEHPEVHEWLELLGGDDVEAFLDWCAAVTFTADQPLAALYIEGPPGIGKSLFANGVASLWGHPPVDYSQVTGSFNGGLLNSPILFADEGIRVDRTNEAHASEVFRNLVANVTHSINPKFGQLASLQAALRVIIAANGPDGLPFTRALGGDGIDAIIERVLKIRTGHSPRSYLELMGGRDGVNDWIRTPCRPGKIAEHLLWLRDNRKLSRKNKRFLVAGTKTEWHAKFAANQGLKPAVLYTIWKLLHERGTALGTKTVYLAADKEEQVVWTHPGTVYDLWGADIRRPKPVSVKDTIQQLAAGGSKPKRFGGAIQRCYPIPFETFDVAEVASVEDLMAL